ncbi:M10 family metallopeptidase C-terminal domain-containing protein [Pseudoroseicyclus sp. CXY001]|uniref:M10 family metallopeptidase C-terminal domain-containing protein n=1 Tax=Pseudoroseicyclus sp. CXY001 TaxID=3242492 RepID=UPI003570CE03
MATKQDQQLANYLVSGYWQAVGSVPHHFKNPGNVITYDTSGLSAAGKAMAADALEAWSLIANITFRPAGGNADMRFSNNSNGPVTNATFTTDGAVQNATVTVPASFREANGSNTGDYGFQTYMHEIGHALGLGHPGQYNQSASFGSDAKFPNDSWQTTVMSYFSQSQNSFTDADRAVAVTPMLADIIAMQAMYGPQTGGPTAGNTVWGVGANTGTYLDAFFAHREGSPTKNAFAIYDTGGRDHINFSDDRADQEVSLSSGVYSDVYGLVGNMVIAPGTTIEIYTAGSGDDSITGTAAANTINGSGGNDVIDGVAGRNKLDGGAGHDTVLGGGTHDIIYGGGGNDVLAGDNGRDRLEGGAGDDEVKGQKGFDTLFGGAGEDKLYGDSGNDLLFGQNGDDTLAGGTFDDRLEGGDGADVLFGGGGNDKLFGGNDDDAIFGGFGDDLVLAGNGDDLANGQAGDDKLRGSLGFDYLRGGAGDDLLDGGAARDTAFGDTGNDSLFGGEGSDLLNGGAGDDLLGGGDQDDEMYGARGNDELFGQDGDDSLFGNDGNDMLNGGDGEDRLDGGSGTNELTGGAGADAFVFTDGGTDTITDFSDNVDTIYIDRDLLRDPSMSERELAKSATTDQGGMTLALADGHSIRIENFYESDALADDLVLV